MVTIGAKIRMVRNLLDIRQEDLARACGLQQYHLSIFERDRMLPTPETIKQIEQAFGVSLNDPELDRWVNEIYSSYQSQQETEPSLAA